MRFPNNDPMENRYLVEEIGGGPTGLEDIVLLCDLDRVELMRNRYPHIRVFPLACAMSELMMDDIMALLGINDPKDDRIYTKVVRQRLSDLTKPTLSRMEDRIKHMDLDAAGRRRLESRMSLLRDHICDEFPVRRLRRRGRLIVVDPRSKWRSFDDVMTLNALTASVLARRAKEQDYNMVVRVDESKEFLMHRACSALLQMCYRKRRHMGLFMMLAAQNPESVPLELLSNADLVAVGKLDSQDGINYIARAKPAFLTVTAEDAAKQDAGQMIIWADEVYSAVEPEAKDNLVDVRVRGQNTQHGGKGHMAVQEGGEAGGVGQANDENTVPGEPGHEDDDLE
jgi:hypothetical protein